MSSLFDAALNLRERLLSSARFQRFAAAFPLTRPIARRRARALFDLVAGFVYSQILAACVRLDVFNILASSGPQTAAELSARLNLSLDATQRLLVAAKALNLLEARSVGRFGLGPLGAALVGNPGIVAMIEHHALLYKDLDDPVALLRGEQRDGALGQYWPYAGSGSPATLSEQQVSAYSALMAASQPLVSGEILAAYGFSGRRCLLDVGPDSQTMGRADCRISARSQRGSFRS